MKALMAEAAATATEAAAAEAKAGKIRRKSKELTDQLSDMAAASDAWKSLHGILGSRRGSRDLSVYTDEALLEAAFGGSSDEDEADEAASGTHGEMAVSKAQRTRAVRVPSVFSAKEVKQLLKAHRKLKERCGASEKKHGEGAQNWSTTFLHTDGLFAATLPALRQKILDTAASVDEQQGWGLLADPPSPPQLRCVELHTVGPGGALPERKHYDHGSLVTVDIMLSPTANFEGGTLQTLETDGTMLDAHFEKGDATVFVSHKYHCVAPVTAGKRQVLVAEVWAGVERECAHRCEQHEGDCPISLALSRAATGIEGLDAGAYGHWLNEQCLALRSSNASERANAKDALARLEQLSEDMIGGGSRDAERIGREVDALRTNINDQAAARANHYDMDGADDY